MWQEVWNTVLSEFSDIPDATQITRITLRLLVAAALGGLLGYEREKQGKSAGVRTHMLVAIGAALFGKRPARPPSHCLHRPPSFAFSAGDTHGNVSVST